MNLWTVVITSNEIVKGYIVQADVRGSATNAALIAWYDTHNEKPEEVVAQQLATRLYSKVWEARELPNRKVEAWPVVVSPNQS